MKKYDLLELEIDYGLQDGMDLPFDELSILLRKFNIIPISKKVLYIEVATSNISQNIQAIN
ncbi:MAG: hypothetical protein U9R16_10010, partial [Campylobacterota bacterium]|nr:hypothetical protein [Campylobacterota bacterium]